MEVNETRNCLVTDILLTTRKSAEWIQLKLWGSCKMSLFPKKWSIPLIGASFPNILQKQSLQCMPQ